MKLIDIIIFSICSAGLVYLFFDRRKYSNVIVYHEKINRLFELKKEITAVENNINNTDNIIKSLNFDKDHDEELYNKFIDYRDNEEKLNQLKNEQKEIEKYIKNANMYKNVFKNIFRI